MKRYLQNLAKGVVLAPLPVTLGVLIATGATGALYWLADDRIPDWFRIAACIVCMPAPFLALVGFCFRQARETSEEIEKLLESLIRIRKLRDQL